MGFIGRESGANLKAKKNILLIFTSLIQKQKRNKRRMAVAPLEPMVGTHTLVDKRTKDVLNNCFPSAVTNEESRSSDKPRIRFPGVKDEGR